MRFKIPEYWDYFQAIQEQRINNVCNKITDDKMKNVDTSLEENFVLMTRCYLKIDMSSEFYLFTIDLASVSEWT